MKIRNKILKIENPGIETQPWNSYLHRFMIPII